MSHKSNTHSIPYPIQRIIRRYAPYLQSEIAQVVKRRMDTKGSPVTVEEIGECASEIIFGEGNLRLEKLCMQAYRSGHSRPIQEVIDELRGTLAGPSPA
jgi:hypothetical protein